MALGWRKQYFRYKQFFLNVVSLYKERRDIRMFLEILLSLITISFFIIAALRPTLIAISGLLQEIKEREETTAKMDKKIKDLALARSIFNQESARIVLVKSAIPETPTPETFVRQVEGLSQKNASSLVSHSVDEVTLIGSKESPIGDSELSPFPEKAQPMGISSSFSGNYPSLFSLISDLENLRRPLRLDKVTLTLSQSETEKILTLVVSGRVPYFRQSQ